MKKIISIVVALFTAVNGFSFEQIAKANSCQSDGVERRVIQTQQYLRRTISNKELKALSFTEAVVHIKDSLEFYTKVPYKNKKKSGFLLIKYHAGFFNHAKIEIEGYQYNDKRLRGNSRKVEVSSTNKKLNKKFIMNSSGRVEKMLYPIPKKGTRDTAFSITPFLSYGSVNPNRADSINLTLTFDQFEAYIDTDFIFNNIDSLNYDRLNTKVLIHDMIPLAFVTQPSFTLEYSNIDILPAIDIKKLFNSSRAKIDSIPN